MYNVRFISKEHKITPYGQLDFIEDELFGANVNVLLKNGFFMKSTIGKFAQEYINKLIKTMKPIPDESTKKLNYPKIENVIRCFRGTGFTGTDEFNVDDEVKKLENSIQFKGDKIVREKLLDMLDMCIFNGMDKDSHLHRIDKKIERLKKERNKVSNLWIGDIDDCD